MRKLTMTIAALGLAAAGTTVPAAAATAAPDVAAANHCNSVWPGRNGQMYAWNSTYCYNLLGHTAGNDSNWGDNAGAFRGSDQDAASSVMNAGYVGNLDVVAFYYYSGYSGGYGCLSPNEYFVDDLSRNTFTTGYNMNNNIRSHRWVNSTNCSGSSWMS
ncbi:hypothetical protein ACL02U_00470 [Streptomyces sp. MS06]|uniref:hypothetical protein n=1 Tax=Streptomyces sp. MS06 TaxID=3385974 RepID=UPI0039A307B8